MHNALDDIIHDIHDRGIAAYREVMAPSNASVIIVAVFAPDRFVCEITLERGGEEPAINGALYRLKARTTHNLHSDWGTRILLLNRYELLRILDQINCNDEIGAIFKGIYHLITKARIIPITKRGENFSLEAYTIRDRDCLQVTIEDGYINAIADRRANGHFGEDHCSFELNDPQCLIKFQEFLERYKMADAIGDALRDYGI